MAQCVRDPVMNNFVTGATVLTAVGGRDALVDPADGRALEG